MAMNIWHQSFTVLADLADYDAALRKHFDRVSRPDTEIVMHGMRPGTYPSNYPGDDIKHVGMQYLHGLQFIQGAIEAERQGFDAFALSTLPEPALREIKSLVDIPVVGYGEAAMHLACSLGRRFGILVFIDELNELLEQNAHRHGLGDRFVAAEPVGFRFADVLAAFHEPEELITRFKASARRMITKGADVIIPGEAPLNVLLARNGITSVDGVPIIDSLAAWVKQAEALVDLRKQGITHSRLGYFNARPDPKRIEEVMAFYNLGPAIAD